MITKDLYRPLGTSGLSVSPLGVGTNRWAQGTNDQAVFAAFTALAAAGVNFFDTAEVYQGTQSERLLGACLRDRADGTWGLVVATKFRPAPGRESRADFRGALEASLDRLGMQSVDLYYLHIPLSSGDVERPMDWMAEAVAEGKIRAVGVSNFDAAQMRRAAARLATHGLPLAANQVEYSLLRREPETDGVLEACRQLNVALVAYRPLLRGQIAGGADSVAPAPTNQLEETLRRVALKRGKTAGQVALNWLLTRDEHVIPIPGTTDARHALENVGALGWQLDGDEFESIDRASSA
jgi:aryl-alcohol dehydrogenase-like predicted oxidoreductase